jgi:hypothetical protein
MNNIVTVGLLLFGGFFILTMVIRCEKQTISDCFLHEYTVHEHWNEESVDYNFVLFVPTWETVKKEGLRSYVIRTNSKETPVIPEGAEYMGAKYCEKWSFNP